MDAQQLHDYIIKPTLEHMDSLGGNYNTKEARFLLLCTAAIESNCGHFIKQVNGPALGIWQMEPDTHNSIWNNCDAIANLSTNDLMHQGTYSLYYQADHECELAFNPRYACAIARLKYAMDDGPLPKLTSDRAFIEVAFWKQYKRIYNTNLGASTFDKWQRALNDNRIFDVNLGE